MTQSQMKKRLRPNVYQLKDGSRRWWIRATVRDPLTRKRVFRERTLPADFTLQDAVLAQAHLAKLLMTEDVQVSRSESRTVLKMTVRDYAEQWMKVRGPRLRSSTRERYIRALANHILPTFGDKEVDTLTRDDVERWVSKVERKVQPNGRPYAAETMLGWWRVAKTLLSDAAAHRQVDDPTRRVRPPVGRVRGVREQQTLSESQLMTFLHVVKESFPEWHAEVFTLATTGMRPGELYELRWKDVDYKAGRIHVIRAHVRGSVDLVKTGDPREVPLSEGLKAVLQAHQRKALEATWQIPLPGDLVFSAAHGGHRLPQSLIKPMAQASHIAELPFRVTAQVLRRTLNTLLLEAGVNAVVIRSILGHASSAMTSRYAGIHLERKVEAIGHIRALAIGPSGRGGR